MHLHTNQGCTVLLPIEVPGYDIVSLVIIKDTVQSRYWYIAPVVSLDEQLIIFLFHVIPPGKRIQCLWVIRYFVNEVLGVVVFEVQVDESFCIFYLRL